MGAKDEAIDVHRRSSHRSSGSLVELVVAAHRAAVTGILHSLRLSSSGVAERV